jgi:hypothetical protein
MTGILQHSSKKKMDSPWNDKKADDKSTAAASQKLSAGGKRKSNDACLTEKTDAKNAAKATANKKARRDSLVFEEVIKNELPAILPPRHVAANSCENSLTEKPVLKNVNLSQAPGTLPPE